MSNPNSPTVVAVSPTMHPPATVAAGTILDAAPAAAPKAVHFYCGICMTLAGDTVAFCGESSACRHFHFCKPCLAEYYGIAIRESLGWLPRLRCPVPACRKVLSQESWARVALPADVVLYNRRVRELIPYRCPYCDKIAHFTAKYVPEALAEAEELMVRVRRVLGNERRVAIRATARRYARHQCSAGELVDLLAAAYDDLCAQDGFHADVLLSPDVLAERDAQKAAAENARRLTSLLNAKLRMVEQIRLARERQASLESGQVVDGWEPMAFAGLCDDEFLEEIVNARPVRQEQPRPARERPPTPAPLPSTLLTRVASTIEDPERRMNLLMSICRRFPVIDAEKVQCCPSVGRFVCLECQLHVDRGHAASDCRARNGSADSSSETRMRQCPGCGVATVRTSGCSQMFCPCGVNWCYACGKEYDGHSCTGELADDDGDEDFGMDLFG